MGPIYPASCCGPYLTQDDGAGLQGRQRKHTCLPPVTGQTSRSSTSTLLYNISWPTGTAIAESKQSSLSKVTTSLFWNELPTNVRTAESLTIFLKKDSRLICSDFTSTLHSLNSCPLFNFIDMLWLLSCNKLTYFKLLWTKASSKCPTCKQNLTINWAFWKPL